jgi:hypothetical protein
MTAIDFPDSPNLNDTFTSGGRTWIWNGTVWNTVTTQVGATGPTGPTGPAGSGTTLTEGTGINIVDDVVSVDTTVIAETNSPTFTGLTDFTGIVDFSESVVLGIDVLPSQIGEDGNYLTTDGVNASWAPIPAQTPHPFSMIG